MTPEQFAYWLQGFTELTSGQQPTPEQWQSITEHLKKVFVKVTPPVQWVGPIVAAPARNPLHDQFHQQVMRDQRFPIDPYVLTC